MPRDDWLDHSFAELEREMGMRPDPEAAAPVKAEPVAATATSAPAGAPEELAHTAPPTAVAHDTPPLELTAHETEAPHAIEAEPAPVEHPTVSAREAPAQPAVIGRYESEGTSYVMYADGSIDAQSEAGIYRFASMAELKAFIES